MRAKKFLSIFLALTMMVGVLTGCQSNKQTNTQTSESKESTQTSTSTPAESTTTETQEESPYKQAPKLDDLVKSGEIPAVEERLPKEPMVVTPKSEVGNYGETFYTAFPSGYYGQAYQTLGLYEPFLVWSDDKTELVPNIFSAYEMSEDGTTFSFTIREGLKWSDGAPVTTEDVRYMVEDVWNNPSLGTGAPASFVIADQPVKLEIVDDYSFKLVFAAANASFQYTLTMETECWSLIGPSHYLKQFNDKYTNADELQKLAEKEGFDTWVLYYEKMNAFFSNPELPVLYAWAPASISEDGNVHVFERNPYYFKVDSEGNQLPYMDTLQVEYVDNTETLNLKIMGGEVDYIYAPAGESLTNYPLFAQNMETGNYHMSLTSDDFAHRLIIMPNLSSQDEQKGQLLSNKDFRIALSHAINREELVNLFGTVADYKADIAQQSPAAGSQYYNETLTKQYTEYDVAKANELLDNIGLTARDKDGYRKGPDGKDMIFEFAIPDTSGDWLDLGLRIAEHWKAVGINVEVRSVSGDMWDELVKSNNMEITAFSSGAGGMLVATARHINAYGLKATGWNQRWAYAWAQYVTSNGEQGIEPPEYINELNALRDEVLAVTDPDELKVKIEEYLNKYGEIFPTIGVMRILPQFVIMSNDLKNTPDDYELFVTFDYGVGANVKPYQFYK